MNQAETGQARLCLRSAVKKIRHKYSFARTKTQKRYFLKMNSVTHLINQSTINKSFNELIQPY